MASSAEYELEKRVEKLELFPVELEKGGKENQEHYNKEVYPVCYALYPFDRIAHIWDITHYRCDNENKFYWF